MPQARHGNRPVTREKLIEAAGQSFAEKGLHGTSIRDITQRAGANIASVNYHFHDKFELYAVVLRRAHEGIVAVMNQPLTASTPEGRMRQLLSAMLSSALDPARPKWHQPLLARELVEPTPALDLMHDMMDRPSRRLEEVVREIRPDLSPKQLMLTVSAIVAQCLFHVHHGHLERRMFRAVPEPTLDVLIKHVTEFSLAALRGMCIDDEATAHRQRVASRPRSNRAGPVPAAANRASGRRRRQAGGTS